MDPPQLCPSPADAEILPYVSNPRPPKRTTEEIKAAKRQRYRDDEDFRILKRVQAIAQYLNRGGKIGKESTRIWYNTAVLYLKDKSNPKPDCKFNDCNKTEDLKTKIEQLQARLAKIEILQYQNL